MGISTTNLNIYSRISNEPSTVPFTDSPHWEAAAPGAMVDSQGTLRIFVNGRQVAKGPNIQTQAVFFEGWMVKCWSWDPSF